MEGREIRILEFEETSYQELYRTRKRNTKTQGTETWLYYTGLPYVMMTDIFVQLFVFARLKIPLVFDRICPFDVYSRLWLSNEIFDLRNACVSGSACSLWSQDEIFTVGYVKWQ